MRILIGTTNPSKAKYFERLMDGLDVQIITLADLGIADEPQETGRTPLENARIKAEFYSRYADAVICADSGLYFDSLPPDDARQPGVHVRTPQGGMRLDDDGMITYYAQLVHSLGGSVHAYYMDAMALYIDGTMHDFAATREEAEDWAFDMVDVPSVWRRAGWPLDSLSKDGDGYYFLDPAACSDKLPQERSGYWPRLRIFLEERLK